MKNQFIFVALLGGLGLLHFPLTAVAQPVATTLAATSVAATNATINGSVNPVGAITTAHYEYGLTTNYGNQGGFIVLPATNTAQTLPGLVVNTLYGPAGADWTLTSAPSEAWEAIAASGDGLRLVAAVFDNGLYSSTNGGASWTLTSAPSEAWLSIAASADGWRLAAAAQSGIFTSTNGGVTWTQSSAPAQEWQSIASSTDGTRLAAVIDSGGIYTSTNSGGTWTLTSAPSEPWQSIASSADGTRLAAAIGTTAGGGIYTSTNSGVTWKAAGLNYEYTSIASSADGLSLVALVNDGDIYTSKDGGVTWTQTSAPLDSWQSAASSADGMRLAATVTDGTVYASTDGGVTWTPGNAPGAIWTSIASSADGTRLAITAFGGGVYISAGAASPVTPVTTYHYRVAGLNIMGTNAGNDLTFTTPTGEPTATTSPAGGITTTNATLNGSLYTGGLTTSAYFRYGLTTSYGNYSATNTFAATNITLSVSTLISSLTPLTNYHFQVVANNSAGTAVGGDLTFTTLPLPPTVTTLAATSIIETNATLNGTVNPNGVLATAYFQYGLTANYGNIGGFMTLPATNTTLALPGLVVNALHSAAGANWTNTGLPSTDWSSVASSADGSRLAAVIGGNSDGTGGIYTSTNGGVAWTQTSAPDEGWGSIASSADGTRLAAAVYGTGAGGYIYTSTDAGVTWRQNATPPQLWYSIASSADGMRLVAADGLGYYIWMSTDGGVTWGPAVGSPDTTWYSVASSADGSRLAAGGISGIYTSADGGVTWTATSQPGANWYSIATSADGSHLAAADYGGGIVTSTGTATAFTPGTTYHYSVVAMNSTGTSVGNDLNFTIPGAPAVTTLAATSITPTNASLNGTVDPNGAATSAYFQYGLTTSYGSFSATNILAATNITLSVTNLISKLTPGTTYHFQLVAGNSVGTALGGDLTFTTPAPPAVTTSAATSITSSNAILNGTVNPNGAATSAYYRYGLTTSYGGFSATNTLAVTNIILSVTNLIGSLTPGTAYHFQLVAGNSIGTNAGTDMQFTTGPAVPIVTTLAASSVAATNAVLNGTVNPYGAATTVYFQYGLTTSYGSYSATNTLAATNIVLSATNLVSNLSPGTTYHFRLLAGNSVGTNAGGDLAFTTSTAVPTAATLTASSVTATNAILNGTVNPNGAATTVYFQYGLTASYGSYSTTNTLAATNVALSVTNLISSLSPGTAYHFRLLASNSVGTNAGADLTFTTSAAVPAAATLAASSVTATNAVLNDTVNPNGATTTAYFQYGLTTSYGSYSATNILAATNVTLSVTNLISSLSSGTTYHFRLLASNSVGTNAGADLTFTTSTAVPAATTLAASSVTATNAVLNGTVNPNGAATTVYFQYGLTASYGSYSTTNTLAATNVALSVTNLISSLSSGTTYHFRLLASNSVGTNAGADLTFTTSAAVPASTTLAASGVTATNAVLNGTVNPNGAATTVYFQYGLTASYGSYSTTNTLATTNVALSVTNLISSLSSGTTYHFRLLASNSVGTNAGADQTFTAGSAVPAATTLAASGVTSTTAALNGTVNPNGAATSTYFRYGLTTSYGSYSTTNTLAATNIVLSVTNLISSLRPGTTYHFQLVASNNVGTGLGNDLTFTNSPAAPVVTTLAASSVTATNAILNGTVNPNGAATSAYFRYGLTTSYGSYSTTNTLAATNVVLSVSNLISSLAPGTTYHFQWVAGNSVGTNAGVDLTFTTLAQSQAVNFSLKGAVKLAGGAFQFTFTNLDGLSFTVLTTTNVTTPLTNWTVLGSPTEAPPGQYQFTDPQATNTTARFYRVTSP